MSNTPKTILIVEDDQFLASAYRLKIEKAGYNIAMAADGAQAWEFLKTSKPDLIVLDIMMPNMDGFTLLEKIKQDPIQKTIPVIIASNLSQSEDINRAKELGADDYILKSGIKLKELLVKIHFFLDNH